MSNTKIKLAQIIRSCFIGLAVVIACLFTTLAVQGQTVTADFGSRSGRTAVVPSGIFAVGGTGSSLQDSTAISMLTSASLNQTRTWVSLAKVYATTSPNWNDLDWNLRIMQNAGVHPMMVIVDTPPSLGWSSCTPPSSSWQWGQMAASVVAHVNAKYPGLARNYEIWNEPELSLCAGDDTARLKTYLSLYGAAASAMHAQAASDGQPIRTGGPVLSVQRLAPVWIPALLSDARTAPFVDFVSFHLYLTGQSDIDGGMNWSKLYSKTQATTGGLSYYYRQNERMVRQGHQPNPWSTPIYISEYNDGWAFAADCCRNNPTYGPLWNSVAIADLLNVVYQGSTGVPTQLGYYNTEGSYFCMFGAWNGAMDCQTYQLDPYPQFSTFELFSSPKFLNLQAGGHMAASVSPASTTSGLTATAFYTSTADSVVVINPTYSASSVNIVTHNTGLSSATGTVYLLDANNSRISSWAASLTPIAGGYSTTVSVPALSTVALSIQGGQSSGGPQPPHAVLKVTPQTGWHPLVILADSSQSSDSNSPIVGRTIRFGDGGVAYWTPVVSHTYTKAGTYTVTLSIKDQSGLMSTAQQVVTVY